jgi:DNA-binding MarR family transcriptional regulator
MGTTPAELDPEIVRRVGYAWRELRRGAAMNVLRDHFFGAGAEALEPGQWDTLDVLVTEPSWRMGDLADALRVEASTATRAVERLVRAGLAEKAGCADDKRVVRVSATDAGRRRHAEASRVRAIVMERILQQFDDDERRHLADLMERFVGALDDLVAELQVTPGSSPATGESAPA